MMERIEAWLRLRDARRFQAEAKASARSIDSIGAAWKRAGVAGTAAATRLTAASARLAAASRGLRGAGAAMKSAFTVPIALVGAGAAYLAIQFEDSMSKIVGLVGIAKPQVDAMGESVLELAKALPQSPKELAEALFFITSAGLRGERAMDALEQSARAAAGGLGETKVVADAVTSAMNAYANEGLTAKQSTDILVAAVREGKAEADSFAPSFGKILPIASEMGVEFQEVAAAMATMTRTGSSAAEAGTALRSIMTQIAKPSVAMTEGLDKMGMSIKGVRASLAERGLLPTLKELRDKAKENKVEMADLFGNVRGLSGAFQLVGKNAAATDAVFKGLGKSAGSTDKAFAEASKTAKFQLASAWSSVQVAGVRLGRAVLPVLVPMIKSIASWVGRMSDRFEKLSPGMKKAIIIFALILAVLGPLLIFLGLIAGGVAAVGTALAFVAANPVVLIIAGIALLVVALVTAYKKSETFRSVVSAVFNAVRKAAGFAFDVITFGIRQFLTGIAKIANVASKLPGMGWLKGVSNAAKNAAAEIAGVGDKISGIPNKKTLTMGFKLTAEGERNLQKLNRLPSRGGPSGTGSLVPELASGGVVSGTGSWITGEAGPELNTLRNGSVTVVPLAATGTTVPADTALHSSNTKRTIVVKSYLGRRQIAESVVEDAEDELARR